MHSHLSVTEIQNPRATTEAFLYRYAALKLFCLHASYLLETVSSAMPWPSIPPLPEGRGIRNHPRKRSSMRKIAAKLFSTQRGITLKSVMDRSPGTTCASRACNLKLWACDPDNGTVVKICTSCMSALVHLNKFHVCGLKVAHALKYTFLWMWLRRTIARDQRERESQ